jgi:serine protease AprX
MKNKSLIFSVLVMLSLIIAPFSSNATMVTVNTSNAVTIGKHLEKALEDSSITSLEVIVTFNGTEAPSVENVNLLTSLGITKGITLQSLPMAGVIATHEQIESLSNNSQVRSIYLNRQLQYDLDRSTKLIGAQKVHEDAEFQSKNGGLPVSGNGIGVIVNDSGIDGTHQDLEYGKNLVQNVYGGTNLNAFSSILPVTYTEDVPSTDHTGGHGTHVAGIVGGTGAMSAGKYEGVAPGADLIGYGSGAGLFILDTLTGFDYAITHQFKYNIRVVTNSWGSTGDVGTNFDPEHPTNLATKKCYDRGIVVVFSAGNSGGDGNHTITGNFKKAPWVITVANGDKYGKLSGSSSRGLKNTGGTVTVDGKEYTWVDAPSITAPGTDIISTRVISPIGALGTTKDISNQDPGTMPFYTTLSGTSMAAPHIAGVVALMLDADPTLSPDEVKTIIQNTATNMPGYEPWEVGAGYVNAYAAVDEVYNNKGYGKTLNSKKEFPSSAADTNDEDVNFGLQERLINVNENGKYNYDAPLTRIELARNLVMGAGIRQSLENTNFSDVSNDDIPYVAAVTAIGGVFNDAEQQAKPVMLADNDTFNPNGEVSKVELAYAMIQALNLQSEAEALSGHTITAVWTFQNVNFDVVIKDQEDIPAELKGYVQLAIDRGYYDVEYVFENGDILAVLNPYTSVTKGEYATIAKNFFGEYY